MHARNVRAVSSLLFAMAGLTTACHHGMPPAGPPLPRGTSRAMLALGDSLFNQGACRNCHGVGAVGGPRAPSLVSGPWLQSTGSFEEIVAIITTGVPKNKLKDPSRPFAMNPRGGPMKLTDDQVRAVATYVWSISRGKK